MNELQIYINNLKSENEDIRRQSVEMLGEIKVKEATDALIDAFYDSSWRVRKTVVESLGKHNDIRSIYKLIEAIKDEQIEVHSAAIDAIVNLGSEALPFLVPLLKEPNPDVRILVANIFGFIAQPDSSKYLIQHITDEDVNVKYAIIESLGKIKDKESIPVLIEQLKIDNFFIQTPAIIALGEIGDDSTIEYLISYLTNPFLTQSIIVALGKIGDAKAISPLLTYVSGEEEIDDDIVIASIVAIYQIYKKQIELDLKEEIKIIESLISEIKTENLINKLFNLTKNRDEFLQRAALTVLSWLIDANICNYIIEFLSVDNLYEMVEKIIIEKSSISQPYVIKNLSNDNFIIRMRCAKILGLIGDDTSISNLRKLLKDPSLEVKKAAVYSLGWLQAEEAIDDIIKLYGNENIELNTAIIGSLSLQLCDKVKDWALKLFESSASHNKMDALNILGIFNMPDTIDKVIEAFSDENIQVKLTAIKLCMLIRNEKFLVPLQKSLTDSNMQVRELTAVALGYQNNPKSLDFLINALKSPDMWVRFFAVKALGLINDKKAVTHLVKLLDDEAGNVQIVTIEALTKLKAASAANKIIKKLFVDDEDIIVNALNFLGETGNKKYSMNIVSFLKHSNWRIRKAVIETLGKLKLKKYAEDIYKVILNDSEIIVQKSAIEVLGSFKLKKYFIPIVSFIEVEEYRSIITDILLNYGNDLVYMLEKNYDDFNPIIKKYLAEVLSNLKKTEHLENILIRMLSEEDSNVKRKAIIALGKIKSQKAVKYLLPLAYPDKVIIKLAREVIYNLRK